MQLAVHSGRAAHFWMLLSHPTTQKQWNGHSPLGGSVVASVVVIGDVVDASVVVVGGTKGVVCSLAPHSTRSSDTAPE